MRDKKKAKSQRGMEGEDEPPIGPTPVAPVVEPWPIPGLGPIPDTLGEGDPRPDHCFLCEQLAAGAHRDQAVVSVMKFIGDNALHVSHEVLFERAAQYVALRFRNLPYRTSAETFRRHCTEHGVFPQVQLARNLRAVNAVLDSFFQRGLLAGPDGAAAPPNKDTVASMTQCIKLQKELLASLPK